MTDKLMKFASASAIAALMTAPAFAQENATDWDANQDQMVTQDEFDTGWGETGTFGEWDADASGAIDQEEFDLGVEAGFDADASGDLDDEEQTAMDESDWADADMATWDEDASGDLNEEEFNQGVFGEYDEDESGDWNEEETAMFQDDAGDEGFWDW